MRQLVWLALAACGGSDAPFVPTGTPRQYVVDAMHVPVNNQQSRDFSLDLNGDDEHDNQLGMVLGTMAGQGFDVQAAVDPAVANGTVLQLLEMWDDGFTLYSGADPSVAPCNDANDTVCGHHLDGSASFAIAAGSADDEPLEIAKAHDVYTGGPGTVDLAMTFDGKTTFPIHLIGSRVRLSGVSDTGIANAVVGGLMPLADVHGTLVPALLSQLILPAIARDCPGSTAAVCFCRDGSNGKQMIALFDKSPADCTVSADEVEQSFLFSALLAGDLEIDGTPGMSFGVELTAVAASF